jgi:hypothetical protein
VTVSDETDHREARLRELFDLGVLNSDEFRAELPTAPEQDKEREVTFRALRAALA